MVLLLFINFSVSFLNKKNFFYIFIITSAWLYIIFIINHLPSKYCLQYSAIRRLNLQKHFQPNIKGNDQVNKALYVITPTFPKLEQISELVRLEQTLRNVPDLTWIVAEDALTATPEVVKLLERSPVKNVYLLAPMPEEYRKIKKYHHLPRGVSNRLAGLGWIRKNAVDGVVYFADDDNTYDIKLFEEIRKTQKISVLPVGLASSYVDTPLVHKGKVVGFYAGWKSDRKFEIDMAGFAFSVTLLLSKPNATMPYKAAQEETKFLESLEINITDIEPLAKNCTEVLVWHTHSKKHNFAKKITNRTFPKNDNMKAFFPE